MSLCRRWEVWNWPSVFMRSGQEFRYCSRLAIQRRRWLLVIVGSHPTSHFYRNHSHRRCWRRKYARFWMPLSEGQSCHEARMKDEKSKVCFLIPSQQGERREEEKSQGFSSSFAGGCLREARCYWNLPASERANGALPITRPYLRVNLSIGVSGWAPPHRNWDLLCYRARQIGRTVHKGCKFRSLKSEGSVLQRLDCNRSKE